RQAFDVIDVGLFHLAQELAGVRGERLYITTLALGVDRVEGQRALAGAGEAGNDDELVARDRNVDVLEVMLARTAHDDGVKGHWRACLRAWRPGIVLSWWRPQARASGIHHSIAERA